MSKNWQPSRLELEGALTVLEEYKRRWEAERRRIIQQAAKDKKITPEVVTAYAELHLRDDFGRPISPAAHHRLWLRLLCDERIKKLLIIAPPESAKTTWVISAYLGCRIGIFPERSTIIASASGGVAEKRSVSLRTMVESDAWRQTFGGVERAQGMKWTPLEWSLALGGRPYPGRLHPTIAAYGPGGSITGSRADEVVADDLLDLENSRTEGQREFIKQWTHSSLLSRRKSRVGRSIVIGTPWHAADMYADMRREGGWVVCHTPLLSPGETVYAQLTYPDNWAYEVIGEPVAEARV